jgi:hypothetical protein
VRRMLIVLSVAALMVAMMAVGAGPASAQGPPEPFAHPFCGSGEEFAHGHIVSLAQEQTLGEAHGHNPGGHQGFAVCNPAGIFE